MCFSNRTPFKVTRNAPSFKSNMQLRTMPHPEQCFTEHVYYLPPITPVPVRSSIESNKTYHQPQKPLRFDAKDPKYNFNFTETYTEQNYAPTSAGGYHPHTKARHTKADEDYMTFESLSNNQLIKEINRRLMAEP